VYSIYCSVYFFFSSRRRHTRFSRDWSSDVCSSDLAPHPNCTCGFYALPSKRDLMMTYTIMGNAIALVQLSGTVIEHENGYRAERQTILQITDVTCGHGAGCGHGKDRGPAKYLVREDAKARVLTPYCEDCMRLYPQ